MGTRDYDAGATVTFDGVLTNYGEHYSASTSVFQCPYNGIYMFSVHYNSADTSSMHCEIMRDAMRLTEGWATTHTRDSSGSAQVITECLAGEDVWVRAGFDKTKMYGDSTRTSSHFTGYMLYSY